MDNKICRFCDKNIIPAETDICDSCDALLNGTSKPHSQNPYDSEQQIEDDEEEL